jgi:hypothetical protein
VDLIANFWEFCVFFCGIFCAFFWRIFLGNFYAIFCGIILCCNFYGISPEEIFAVLNLEFLRHFTWRIFAVFKRFCDLRSEEFFVLFNLGRISWCFSELFCISSFPFELFCWFNFLL